MYIHTCASVSAARTSRKDLELQDRSTNVHSSAVQYFTALNITSFVVRLVHLFSKTAARGRGSLTVICKLKCCQLVLQYPTGAHQA